MVFKGNFKGRRRTKSGRKMSKKAAELGRKTSRDNKILKKRNDELQKLIRERLRKREAEEARANAEASKRMRLAAEERKRERWANDPERTKKIKEADALNEKFHRERAMESLRKAGNYIPSYESREAGKSGTDGTVTIKEHVRKLANGTVINVRSFLRRISKKISK